VTISPVKEKREKGGKRGGAFRLFKARFPPLIVDLSNLDVSRGEEKPKTHILSGYVADTKRSKIASGGERTGGTSQKKGGVASAKEM